jgi:hypothetical protein
VSSPSVQDRYVANSVTGANRLDQYGHTTTPRARRGSVLPAVPQPGDSAASPIKIEGSPGPAPAPIRTRHARSGSVTMTDAPPSPSFPAGVTTTRSRSSYIREPNVDYSNAEVAERVARMHEQRAAEIRAGLTVQGSPSTPGSSGSESSAIRGPGTRTCFNLSGGGCDIFTTVRNLH